MYYFYDTVNRGTLFIRCMEAVCISESPLWEVPLYTPSHASISGPCLHAFGNFQILSIVYHIAGNFRMVQIFILVFHMSALYARI